MDQRQRETNRKTRLAVMTEQWKDLAALTGSPEAAAIMVLALAVGDLHDDLSTVEDKLHRLAEEVRKKA